MSNALNKGAGSEASLPVTSRSRRSAPKLLFRSTQHCRARWARPTSRGKRFGFLLLVFFVAGVSPLRRRVGGFAVASDTPSQRTSMLLDFLCCRGISRLRARVGGFAVASDTPSQRTSMLLDFSCCKGELHLPLFFGKKVSEGCIPSLREEEKYATIRTDRSV